VAEFLIYGTFMRSQPGHANLAGGRFLEDVRTAPRYRLWFVDGLWPSLAEAEAGVEIAAELYELEPEHVERLAAIEPDGWRRAPVELADGREVEAFLGPARGEDVSAHGGWASFMARR
jgi:gamma-glutamylcyclotransferase (GGCT)/AIG2-like uncharacterized protein YtfP